MTSKRVVCIAALAMVVASCTQMNKPAAPPGGQPIAMGNSNYAQDGILASSDIYFAGPDAPKGFVLRDPQTKAIKAYVQSTKGVVDLMQYVNQYVEVAGPVSSDKVVGLVVEAQKVTVLGEGKAAPAAGAVPAVAEAPPAEAPSAPPEVPAEPKQVPPPATQPVGPQELMDVR